MKRDTNHRRLGCKDIDRVVDEAIIAPDRSLSAHALVMTC